MTIQHLSGSEFLSLLGGNLKRVARTSKCGDEYAGPCPFCGGRDRFRVQPDALKGGRWWCRHCYPDGRWRSDIDYILRRDLGRIPSPSEEGFADYFRAACETLGIQVDNQSSSIATEPTAPESCDPPGELWQQTGLHFIGYAYDYLWNGKYPEALEYLYQRGLTDEIILQAAIGYNPVSRYRPAERWGVIREKDIWLPAGFVFPWFVGSHLYKINIRQYPRHSNSYASYITIPGSSNSPYGIESIAPQHPLIIVEGVFDSLAVRQSNPTMGSVAVGTTGARRVEWIIRLAQAHPILVATDADDAGDKAALYWLDVFGSRSQRLRPLRKDPGEMLQHGDSLVEWVQQALHRKVA